MTEEAKSLQTPTSGWFPLPASELLLRENVNMHREEGEDGGEDGGMARRNTLRVLVPGCAACAGGPNATACLLILARNDNQLSGDGGGNSGVPHLPSLNLKGANLFPAPPAEPVCADPNHAAPLRVLPMWMMESALTVLHCNIQRE